MGLIVGEIRAVLGTIAAVFGIRRRRTLLLERRHQLDEVFREVLVNLEGVRSTWNEEHHRLNWLAQLHGDLLRTRAWREYRSALKTRVDGGPAIEDALASDLDRLYNELDASSTGYRFDWERRLVDVALQLRAAVESYPRRWWNRVAIVRAATVELPAIETRIVTPTTPAEAQRRALAHLPRGGG